MILLCKWVIKYVVFNFFVKKNQIKSKVFTYHDITIGRTFDDYSVSLKTFENHVDTVYKMGYEIVSIENVKKINHENFLVFTFDDGCRGIIEAAKILKKYNFTATFFITTDFVGKHGFVTWLDLTKIKEMGFQIGSHSKSHKMLSNLGDLESSLEFKESKKCIEDNLNISVNLFAFPYGQKNTFKKTQYLQLKKLGYIKCFTQIPKNQNKNDLINNFLIGRAGIKSFYNLYKFKSLI